MSISYFTRRQSLSEECFFINHWLVSDSPDFKITFLKYFLETCNPDEQVHYKMRKFR
jgi:hypothetical protein